MCDKVDFVEDFAVTEPAIKNLLLDIVPSPATPLPAPSHALKLLHLPPAEFSVLQPLPFNSSLPNQPGTSKFFSFCYPEQSRFPPTSETKGFRRWLG